ncbi:DUF4037 domain-containing protein [Demequina sp. SYSU T00039]|uniref:DUF4037 domain-containing protein n=1 Tax=Demequina lignilytica TaxID=3051663 RepID=A0AAW7M5X6_9MICO|nr:MULTISPECIES: DUF4037 domain-containing protein [unclassified Demequina]MDN4478052.1 DUF4037 domain-containing protein [Demequina sp. SYSU T00039-1]MDN4488498.1 DUF4037 domain-containing protein [Demequina sp. SYSU T00039]MDN4489955.1 DUF4037 domain-containing protein [Demequina sp. SYSU T00068]
MTSGADGSARYDVAGFLRELDAAFAAQAGPDAAERLVADAVEGSRAAGDLAAELTVLNEAMGLHRSIGRHREAVSEAREALALVGRLGLEGTEAHATTLINAATAMRAAGRRDDARSAYAEALAVAAPLFGSRDRRLAALHNNLSILDSDSGDHASAHAHLEQALAILASSSADPATDIDVAATRTNLALVSFALGREDQAQDHAAAAMEIFRRGGSEGDAHYAAALAGHAEASFRLGRLADAVDGYERALAIIARAYGEGSDAHAVTSENLRAARAALAAAPDRSPAVDPPPAESAASSPDPDPAPSPDPLTGLALARSYWEEVGRPMMRERHADLLRRAAVGLVGHGSDALGFDDALSRDHDFGPGFCVWLSAEDFAAHGAALQADYEALPPTHRGHGPRVATPRATGGARRVGVFEIGDFFEGLTGYAAAPAADRPHEWLGLDEATLAAATGGQVFQDPHGAFSAARNGFRRMPEDVRLALVSRRLGMMAQAGQYNVPRMLDRGDGEAAWLAVGEFVNAAASAVFLLNGPASAGYLPYYKWRFAALRALADRMGSRLPGVHPRLSDALRLASAACFGGAGFGEGGKGAGPARAGLEAAIEDVCAQVAAELRAQGLSGSDAGFLEHHRGELAARIGDDWLKGL